MFMSVVLLQYGSILGSIIRTRYRLSSDGFSCVNYKERNKASKNGFMLAEVDYHPLWRGYNSLFPSTMFDQGTLPTGYSH